MGAEVLGSGSQGGCGAWPRVLAAGAVLPGLSREAEGPRSPFLRVRELGLFQSELLHP